MDVGSKFDRAELPLDDDEIDLGKKRGRGDGGDESDGQGVATETERAVTRSSKVYSVFPFWIEASTPIMNLYGDAEATGDEDYEDGFEYDGANDGFQYDGANDLKRVTYYDYDRHESSSSTQVPMSAADAEGNAKPRETTLAHPSVAPFSPPKVQTPLETSPEKPIDILKDRSVSRPTLVTPGPTTTWHTSTTKRLIGTTPTKLTSLKPTWSASTFSESKSTSMTSSASHKGQNRTLYMSKATTNIASSTTSSPSNPTVPTTAEEPMKSSKEMNREHPTKVAVRGELDDHAASTASPYAYEVYDYGEKEYGVNEGSLESDLLRLLDKIARRYNESAEGG